MKKKCACCCRLRPIEKYKKIRRGVVVEVCYCDLCRASRRRIYLENREAVITAAGINQKKNRAHRKIYLVKYAQELRDQVHKKLGRKCVRCGFTDRRALQIDHVNGDGYIERKGRINSYAYLKKVLFDTAGRYQMLCANCNWIKRHENNEQPHARPI